MNQLKRYEKRHVPKNDTESRVVLGAQRRQKFFGQVSSIEGLRN